MKTLLITLIIGFSFNSYAFDKEDSAVSLRQALLNSNKDYNTHKRAELEEENSRISKWSDRKLSSIKIEQGIEVEAKDYQVPEQEVKIEQASEYQQDSKQEVLQEVSMNYSF